MIISYSWSSLALLGRYKKETRRDWSAKQIGLALRRMAAGETERAWSKSPRFKGEHIADIRLVGVRPELASDIPDSSWEAEGFHYLSAIGQEFQRGHSAADVWRYWRTPSEWAEGDNHQTVVGFDLLDITKAGLRMLADAPEPRFAFAPDFYTLARLREDTRGVEGWELV